MGSHSIPRLRRLVLDVIANNFESPSIIEERIPPGIGREIAKVQLRRGNVSGKVLTLACRCRLEELSLEGVTLSEAIVGKLLNMSGHLQSVRLRMIQISLTDLILLLESFQNLRFFEIFDCKALDDELTAILIRKNPNLERFFVSRANISDATLELLSHCKKLKSVDVSYNRKINADAVLKMCEGESREILEDLRITCSDVTPAILRSIHTSCPKMRNFQSINVFYDDLARTPQSCRRPRRPRGTPLERTRSEGFSADFALSDFGSNHHNTQYFIEL